LFGPALLLDSASHSLGTRSSPRIQGADDNAEGPLADILHVPPSFDYDCLKGMQVLEDVFGSNVVPSTLVIREEYKTLLEALVRDDRQRAFVLTGHPGIGSYET